MKAAVLGGSFDPVHNGHISLAEEVRKLGYGQIIFIPAYQPPHKDSAPHPGGHRLAMLSLALNNHSWAVVWDGEIRRKGISYSIDTIRELKKSGMINPKPGLIIGDDLADGFSKWKDAAALAQESRIILARRTSGPPAHFPYRCVRLENKLWPFSSTQIRQIIAEGGSTEGLLAPSVAAYIRRHGLYGFR